MRRYDNYDYEEAFKKYIDDTEEERLEKLLKEGKVNCLYRTATTKCTNIKSQTTLLEAQIYPSYRGWNVYWSYKCIKPEFR